MIGDERDDGDDDERVSDRTYEPETGTAVHEGPGDDAIRELVKRLARKHPDGGFAIERAPLLAAGADFGAVVAWIEAHGGSAEAAAPIAPRRGLYSSRSTPTVSKSSRFLLPASALD